MSDYRGGCTPGMRVATDTVPGCRSGCLHRAIVEDYRAARHAWEALRESDTLVAHLAPGAAGSDVAAYQLEDEDFRRIFPPPTFRAWLEGVARSRHDA